MTGSNTCVSENEKDPAVCESFGDSDKRDNRGLLDRNPVASVVVLAAVGLAIGYALSVWDPNDAALKSSLVR
jgi:hypothetical protein